MKQQGKKGKTLAVAIIAASTLVASGIAVAKSGAFDKKSAVLAPSQAAQADAAKVLSTADSDGDGLSDAQESTLGTDPHKKDTDADGYSDKVEVDSAHDPLKDEGKTTGATTTDADKITEQDAQQLNDYLSKAAANNSGSLSDENISKLLSDFQNSQGATFVYPAIPASDIHVTTGVSAEQYLLQADAVLNKNVYIRDAASIQSFFAELLVSDKAKIASMKQTFDQSYKELAAISVPDDAKDLHKRCMGLIKGASDILGQVQQHQDDINFDPLLKSLLQFKELVVEYQVVTQDFVSYAVNHKVDLSKFTK